MTLFTKHQCTLCDKVKGVLAEVREEAPHGLEQVRSEREREIEREREKERRSRSGYGPLSSDLAYMPTVRIRTWRSDKTTSNLQVGPFSHGSGSAISTRLMAPD